MFVLFETAAGFALFKVLDETKLKQVDNLYKDFQSLESAKKVVSLNKFTKFKDNNEAVDAATSLVSSELGKTLSSFIQKNVIDKSIQDKLAIVEPKLAQAISSKFGIKVVSDNSIMELTRGIRSQMDSLLSGVSENDLTVMSRGLSHGLSRYKLKFSPDKVDTMIVQALGLLDELDKELNIYAMRVREWYGWHFPELGKLVTESIQYAKIVKAVGFKSNAKDADLSFLPEGMDQDVKDAALISMGTEISDEDIANIDSLCDQVINMYAYRDELSEYLKSRMNAIAPNLTIMVGELVGARLIAHAGTLISLAKQPASTVQILGAEKALFRALKTKHDTPKYGLIYHAQLVSMASTKNKGKASRVLAGKATLALRVDAMAAGDVSTEIGVENRARVERRIQMMDGENFRISGGKGNFKAQAFDYKKGADTRIKTNAPSKDKGDIVLTQKKKSDEMEIEEAPVPKKATPKKAPKKVEAEEEEEEEAPVPKKKATPKKKAAVVEEEEEEEEAPPVPKKKATPKKKAAVVEEEEEEEVAPPKRTSKKKVAAQVEEEEAEVPKKKRKAQVEEEEETPAPKKAGKKKAVKVEEEDEE